MGAVGQRDQAMTAVHPMTVQTMETATLICLSMAESREILRVMETVTKAVPAAAAILRILGTVEAATAETRAILRMAEMVMRVVKGGSAVLLRILGTVGL